MYVIIKRLAILMHRSANMLDTKYLNDIIFYETIISNYKGSVLFCSKSGLVRGVPNK